MKLGLLLAAIITVSLVALLLVQRMQQQAMADLLRAEIVERSNTMDQAVELTARGLRDFVSDYAQWDDMVQFVEQPKLEWAAINLDASLGHFDLTGAWVFRVDGSLVYATRDETSGRSAKLPIDEIAVHRLLASPPASTFFVQLPDRLVELCLAPVQPSEDTRRISPARGWFLAERTWNATPIDLLSRLMRCEGRLAAPGAPLPQKGPYQISLRHTLKGAAGEVVADFIYTIRSDELAISSQYNRSTVFVLAGSGLVMAVIAVGALYRWVLRPLGAISNSLATKESAPIGGLARKNDEMGRLARLVNTSFAQRAELEFNLAERARLGRELHDGAIQTVYAAGMTLAGVRSTLRANPDEAERSIDSLRSILNHTIRDLRTFIGELEPEAKNTTRFSDGARAIVTLMQGVRPFAFTLQIDDTLAGELAENVRLHLLHIIRESVSNCVRHSRAQNLTISLRREIGTAALEIADDGEGLENADPEAGGGRGLGNLSERTRELGGTLRLASTPGKGLRVHLSFPCATRPGT